MRYTADQVTAALDALRASIGDEGDTPKWAEVSREFEIPPRTLRRWWTQRDVRGELHVLPSPATVTPRVDEELTDPLAAPRSAFYGWQFAQLARDLALAHETRTTSSLPGLRREQRECYERARLAREEEKVRRPPTEQEVVERIRRDAKETPVKYLRIILEEAKARGIG